jgi:hypothetical protein
MSDDLRVRIEALERELADARAAVAELIAVVKNGIAGDERAAIIKDAERVLAGEPTK